MYDRNVETFLVSAKMKVSAEISANGKSQMPFSAESVITLNNEQKLIEKANIITCSSKDFYKMANLNS